jgi:hypothetical protein
LREDITAYQNPGVNQNDLADQVVIDPKSAPGLQAGMQAVYIEPYAH